VDDDRLNNGEQPVRNKKGQFVKNNNANPNGRPEGSTNKYTITKLIEAIEAEEVEAEKEGGVSVFRQFVRMAYMNPNVMIAIMKKFVPDKQHTEVIGLEPFKWEIEILNGRNKKTEGE